MECQSKVPTADHDHHRDQRRHRDERNRVTEPDDQDQQEDSGEESGDAGPRAGGFHVDHRLADHGAAAHAAEEAGNEVGGTLSPSLAGLVGVGVGDVVDELRGQQGLKDPDERHGERVGGDDPQGLDGERHVGKEQAGEAVGQLALVADVGHAERAKDRETGQGEDRDKGGRDDLADPGKPDHDRDADGDHRVDQPGHVDHVIDLGLEDQDRQGIDEAHHHRARDEPHQLGHARDGEHHLDDAAEDDGGDEVVVAVVPHHRRYDQGHRAGGRRDHGRAAAEERDRHRHRERGEEADPRIDTGDDREEIASGINARATTSPARTSVRNSLGERRALITVGSLWTSGADTDVLKRVGLRSKSGGSAARCAKDPTVRRD